jgi:hypothetical protein
MLQLYSHDYVFSEEHCKSYTFIMMQIKLQISSCQSLLVRLHALKSPAGPEKCIQVIRRQKQDIFGVHLYLLNFETAQM